MSNALTTETRRDLYEQHEKDGNVDQLQKVYAACYQGAYKKAKYHNKILQTICCTCNSEEYIKYQNLANDYDVLAENYLNYMQELEEWTQTSFYKQGEKL